eukprot:TRINITY_DN7602_c0_g1_i2.p1 TRINITY_DN7602_c0_g1~~TRINITY_DN7602_c0_g1_i2.p1  ORF type:complete len:353 (-),score=66.40 TRINITY_DN7602_c0_g1_i2:35-1048(-)
MDIRDDTVILMGGRKYRRRMAHVSMHVENEASGVTRLRRRNIVDRSQSVSPTSVVDQVRDHSDNFKTPENQRITLNDSGYPPSPGLSSDPDWYLRPKQTTTDRYAKKYSSNGVSAPAVSHHIFPSSRPSYVDYQKPRWFLKTEAILGAIVCVIFVASIMFSILISARFFESSQVQLNGKYKSLQFAKQKIAEPETVSVKPPSVEVTKKGFLAAEHIPRDDVADNLPEVSPSPATSVEPSIKPKSKKSKNKNPLIKSPKKVKMSKKKDVKPNVIQDSIENDYDDPSGFRGKNEDQETVTRDSIDNDYDTDPSFRGGNIPNVEVKSKSKPTIVTDLMRN